MTAMRLPREPWKAPRPYKLSVEDFRFLHEAGTFDEVDGRLELLDGRLCAMSPQHLPHISIKNDLAYRLRRRLEERGSPYVPYVEATIEMPPHNMPDADIVLTNRPKGEGYIAVASVGLVVEVAVTTLRHDLGRKKRIYAIAAVPEYWVFDVKSAKVHRFWSPQGRDYAHGDEVPVPGPLASKLMPELAIDTLGLL